MATTLLSVANRAVSLAGGESGPSLPSPRDDKQVLIEVRRGLAGTILVYKLAAALAEQGADLDKVEAIAKYASTRLGTLGIGLDHCHVSLSPLPLSLPNKPSLSKADKACRFPARDLASPT